MKKILALALVLALVAALFAGCDTAPGPGTKAPGSAPETTPADAAPETASAPRFEGKVALVTDLGPVDDENVNQAVWEGVQRACEAAGVDYAFYRPSADSTDARVETVGIAIGEGCNVVVMPGYLFGEAVLRVQDKYPDVYFLAVDVGADDLTYDYDTYYDPSPNTLCLTFEEDQAGYLAGYAAVAEGYTRLGFHGGAAVPAVIRYCYGFLQGANAAAEERGIADQVSVVYAYDNCFCDAVPKRLEAMYSGGVEVVFVGVGIWSIAVPIANTCGGKVIGIDVDQHNKADCILTSAMKRMDVAVEEILTDLFRGDWKGGQVRNLTLQDGDYIGLPTDPAAWRFQSFTLTQYEALLRELRDGTRVCDPSYDFDNLPKVSIQVEYMD